MDRPSNSDRLCPADRERLQELAGRLDSTWRQAAGRTVVVDFRPLLPPQGDRLRGEVLLEFIKIDLEARWRLGQRILLEYYLEQFPELGAAAALPTHLIYEELRVRRRYGDNPPLSAYEGRFPRQFPEMQRWASDELSGDGAPSFLATLPAPARNVAPIQHENAVPDMDPNYKMVQRIGSGAFGEVWRGEAPGGVEVAIKVVKGTVELAEAKRELQALGLIRRLRHPFLVCLHAFWLLQDRLVLVMELTEGSLRDRLEDYRRKGKPGIPPDQLTRHMLEAAEALDYLHTRNLLHRDIKPENLLYLEGHVKVADFGLSRVFEQTRRLVTTVGAGTPAFLAPEVFWQGKVGPRSDQYSLAAAYVDLRLGRMLFPGKDWNTLMHDHLERTPDLAPLPDAEQVVLLRALAKDTNERFGSCGEFAQALLAASKLDGQDD